MEAAEIWCLRPTREPWLFHAAAWTCYTPKAGQDSGNTAPVRDDGYGFVECMSTDGANCLWGTSSACQGSIGNAANLNIKPIRCSKAAMASGAGVCYNGAAALGLTTGKSDQPPSAQCPGRCTSLLFASNAHT